MIHENWKKKSCAKITAPLGDSFLANGNGILTFCLFLLFVRKGKSRVLQHKQFEPHLGLIEKKNSQKLCSSPRNKISNFD